MQLASVPVSETNVVELIVLLRECGMHDVADKLARGLEMETKVLALTIPDRHTILRTLDDPPTDGLAELRGVLLNEHEWRMREGLE